ncbi:MAG: transketolase [Dehalococcoidia bacterium]|nr:MAG: transketolase [Dehalococcoidia bacterium]
MTLDELCINTLRFLSVDAVQTARSGHPGMPMGAATLAYVLWDRFLKHNPEDPNWTDRDRFILSAGHASAMLYSLLYLTGYSLPLEEIKNFRQCGSLTPGHPEYGLAPGVELTTGPLGQGFANGVGMAITERWLAEHYNRIDCKIIDHYTYAICSDGDIMEGVSSEAASLAGTLKLDKLVYIYDDNNISIEGNTDVTFKEDVAKRFDGYGWHVVGPIDGMDITAVDSAIRIAQSEKGHPSLIICSTVIGYGSPNKAGTGSAHGEPLGEDEVLLAKKRLGWNYDKPFTIPLEALKHFRRAIERGRQQQMEWNQKMKVYRNTYPDIAKQLELDLSGDLPAGWDGDLDNLFLSAEKALATREASGEVMNKISPKLHALVGGSADLAPSTKTLLQEKGHFTIDNYRGHNLHFGVREHAMGCIANGMARHGGVIPYTATFLIFYDYMRTPVRLAAMMKQRVIHIFTHDSVGLGEDGPTHQPIEQLAGMRAIPNLTVIRPADAKETVEAWKIALENRSGPTALILTRQKLPIIDRTELAPASGVKRGAYILWQDLPKPRVILIGTGSEVYIALEAGRMLKEKGIAVSVVSMPSWNLFDAQPETYRNSVLPPGIKARVSIEAAATLGWEKYVGDMGISIGIDRFGISAPYKEIYDKLGLTARQMASEAERLLK